MRGSKDDHAWRGVSREAAKATVQCRSGAACGAPSFPLMETAGPAEEAAESRVCSLPVGLQDHGRASSMASRMSSPRQLTQGTLHLHVLVQKMG